MRDFVEQFSFNKIEDLNEISLRSFYQRQKLEWDIRDLKTLMGHHHVRMTEEFFGRFKVHQDDLRFDNFQEIFRKINLL